METQTRNNDAIKAAFAKTGVVQTPYMSVYNEDIMSVLDVAEDVTFLIIDSAQPGLRSYDESIVTAMELPLEDGTHIELYISNKPFIVTLSYFKGDDGMYSTPTEGNFGVAIEQALTSLNLTAAIPPLSQIASAYIDMFGQNLGKALLFEQLQGVAKQFGDQAKVSGITSWPLTVTVPATAVDDPAYTNSNNVHHYNGDGDTKVDSWNFLTDGTTLAETMKTATQQILDQVHASGTPSFDGILTKAIRDMATEATHTPAKTVNVGDVFADLLGFNGDLSSVVADITASVIDVTPGNNKPETMEANLS